MSGANGTGERFLSVDEVARMFGKSKEWVYRNRFGFLRPAARTFNRRLLMFDKTELEHIIEASKEANR